MTGGLIQERSVRFQDARLVPVTLVVWLGVLLGLLWGFPAATACSAAAISVAAVLALRWRGARPRRVVACLAVLVGGAVVAVPVAWRLAEAEHDPVRGYAARGAVAAVRLTVAERPRPLRPAGYADRQAGARSVVIPVDLEEVMAAGTPVATAGRAVVIAPFEGWSRILPGQRVSAAGTLAPARGAGLTVAVLYVRGPPVHAGPAPWWQRAAESMRAALRRACAVVPEEPAGLLPGLVVGDTSALPARVEREFTDAGMSHLTAVSGSNLVIVCGAVLLVLRALGSSPRFSATAAGLVLVGYLVLVGPEPSVLRAGVMGGVGLLAVALGRRGSALPALAAAVCGLIVWDPAMAVSFGFALSVVATAGLVLLAPRWAEALVRRGVPPGFAEGLAVPLAAFVVTAPVIAGMAGRVSVVSVLANVLAAPVVAPATILGVLAAALAPAWAWGAAVLVRLARPEAEWLILVARRASAVPGAVLPWPGGWWGGLLAAVALAAIAVLLRSRRARMGLAVLLAVVMLVFVPVRVIAPGWPPRGWVAVACDVGQGDAIILAAGEPGRAVVIDTGPEPGPVDTCLDRLGVQRVPLVVLSHLHADHIGGLVSLFEGRAVGAVAVGPGRAPGWAWRQVGEIAARRHVPLLELAEGRRLDWPGLRLDVLGPRYVGPRQADKADGTEVNNTSVVLRATTSAGRMLLTGDVELAAQADLLADGVDVHADILKVPHHGSRFSLPQFLGAVSPRVALVSVGAGNTYGHPNRTTVDTLSGLGALVARTDTDGDTAVIPDAQGPAVVRRGRRRVRPWPVAATRAREPTDHAADSVHRPRPPGSTPMGCPRHRGSTDTGTVRLGRPYSTVWPRDSGFTRGDARGEQDERDFCARVPHARCDVPRGERGR